MDALLKNLEKRGFVPHFARNADEVIDLVLQLIPEGATVGFGGSQTVAALRIPQLLDENSRKALHVSVRRELTYQAVSDMASSADWFVASTNALTESGEFVNTDGRSNRIANMVFGAPNVLLIVGKNKIVPDIEAGIRRIREVAAPKNCIRLNKATPCAQGDFDCSKCTVEETICKATLIQHHPTTGKVVHVIIVDEEFGF